MSDIAIRVESLSKQYRIGARLDPHATLRDQLADVLSAPFRRAGPHKTEADTFWALKDVSFEVKRGEVVGIIGRNGAGKSTLLKILSRITKPTSGRAEIHGRVASLLEVGTGFHPELTGRENITLNGAILGMKRREIERKFDEIVAFAEVEKFIDTPVKHFSSGMYVRLAFAVAAHLEPEILLVDEVLAVGDAAFQKKCLGKMGEVAQEGRTVLFVSHDMTSISLLCPSCIWLAQGQVAAYGTTRHVVDQYLREDVSRSASVIWALENAPGDQNAKLLSVKAAQSDSGVTSTNFRLSEPIRLEIGFCVLSRDRQLRLTPVVVVKNQMAVTLFSSANYNDPLWGQYVYGPGFYRTCCVVPAHILNDGMYTIDVFLIYETRSILARVEGAVSFSVHDDGVGRGDYIGEWVGLVRPECVWSGEVVNG